MTSKEAVNLFKQHHWKVKDTEKALEILEKQEELLNKIKEIIDRPFDTSTMVGESKRYVEIRNLIKEL